PARAKNTAPGDCSARSTRSSGVNECSCAGRQAVLSRIYSRRHGSQVSLLAQPGLAYPHAGLQRRRRPPSEDTFRGRDRHGRVLRHEANVHALETSGLLREHAVHSEELHLETGTPEWHRGGWGLVAHPREVPEVLAPGDRARARDETGLAGDVRTFRRSKHAVHEVLDEQE